MKSYTDIKQSKKLADILPLESADYHYITQGEKSYFYPYSLSSDAIKDYDEEIKYIPCWSLAALLDVLPEYIRFDGHTWIFYLEHWRVYYMNVDTFDTDTFSSSTGILIDDVFEIILKLKENNKL